MCTNFGAFITKWRIGLVCRCNSYYILPFWFITATSLYAILQWLKNWQPFCTKGDDFYQEILVIFRRNTCFEWHYSTASIIGWQPFWTLPTMVNTGTISHASISENVHSIVMYICTNFGAFITKWTIGLVCHCTTWRWQVWQQSLGKTCRPIYASSRSLTNLG